MGLALVALACAPPLPPGDPCNQDSDCRPDQLCRAGVCTLHAGSKRDAGRPEDAGGPGDAGTSPGDAGGEDAGAGADGGVDGGGPLDGGDVGVEGGPDAGLDAGADAGPDAGVDDDPDAGLDAGVDAGPVEPMPPPGWHAPDFHARRALDLNHPFLLEDLVDVPVLVKLTPARVDYALAGPLGAGMIFVDEAGATLPHEVDTWRPGGISFVWVRLPRVEAAPATTRFFLYYDHRANSPPSRPPPSEVWAPDHIAVFHLGESPEDPAPQMKDSAGALMGDASGTCMGDMTAASQVTGLLGGALSFDGQDDYVESIPDPLFDVDVGEAITVEAWFRADPAGTGDRSIVYDEYGCQGYNLRINGTDGLAYSFHYRPGCSGVGSDFLWGPEASYADDQWHYAAFVIDRVAGESRLFVDGVSAGTTAMDSEQPGANGGPFRIGTNWIPESVRPAWFLGEVDEVRVSLGARPAAWFATQYMSAYDLLLDFGVVESW